MGGRGKFILNYNLIRSKTNHSYKIKFAFSLLNPHYVEIQTCMFNMNGNILHLKTLDFSSAELQHISYTYYLEQHERQPESEPDQSLAKSNQFIFEILQS